MRKTPLLFVIAIFVFVSLSCTNPITSYFGTQTAIKDTATATMWTPTPTFTPTNTPTNTPTDTPTFTPTPDYLFKDDFSDPDSGWDEKDNAAAMYEYSDGGYRMMVKLPGYFVWSLVPDNEDYDNVRIEVDAQKIGGPNDTEFGLVARYQNNNNFYAFMLTNDGQALIFKIEDGALEGLSSQYLEDVDGINSNDVNAIAVVMDGKNLELYVNDKLVASATDSSMKTGQVGLLVGVYKVAGGDMLFDNMFIRPL
jgi:hypothetical protein